MPLVDLSLVEPVTGAPLNALAGITDLLIYETGNGAVLLSITRGGGQLVSYDLGNAPGATRLSQSWSIGSALTQLESTDLAVLHTGTPRLLMAGLNAPTLLGRSLGTSGADTALGGYASFSLPGVDPRDLTDIAVFDGATRGIVSVRGTGLMGFSTGGSTITATPLGYGQGLQGAAVSDLTTAHVGGRDLALASFWDANAVSLFEMSSTGAIRNIGNLAASSGTAWFSMPMAVQLADVAGQAYAIVAATGSGSLSVFEIAPGGRMTLTDHVIDTRDTRFAGASVVEAVSVNGMEIVVAAGADSGVSAFLLLPGGRLHLLASLEASGSMPLDGITELALRAEAGRVRIFVATDSAPYLTELSLTLPNPGQMRTLGEGGGTLSGASGNDVLTGGSGADRIEGGAGDDILLDGAGSDTLIGGPGADTFIFTADGAADAILDFQPGIDRIDLTGLGLQWDVSDVFLINQGWGVSLYFGTEMIEIRGLAGSILTSAMLGSGDFVDFAHITYTGAGLEVLETVQVGTAGDDILYGDSESNRIKGLTGRDRIHGAFGDDTVWGDDGFDTLYGGPGSDTLDGQGGEDLLEGGDGDDRLDGGFGNDTLRGGLGADTLIGGTDDDTLNGGGHNDLLEGQQGDDLLLGDLGADTLIGGFGADTLNGGDLDDWLRGDAGADMLDGGGGNDVLVGGDDSDVAYGRLGNDLFFGGQGFDTLFGLLGNDTLFGGMGNDRLYGGVGNDSLIGADQNDTLVGDFGNDFLDGGDGNDWMNGGGDGDYLTGRTGNDTIFGGQGFDTLIGQLGDDVLYAGWGNDRAFGGDGNDALWGGNQNDTLEGGAGHDTLTGGMQDDVLTGNAGNDIFVFVDGDGRDTISDFEALNGSERIDLSGVTAIAGLAALDLAHSFTGAAVQSGANVVINTGGGNAITLLGVSIADLDESDFIF